MSDDNTVYVGIDLGTTYSCVMEYDPKGSFIEYRSVKNELSIPSVVKISPNSCNVGTTALNSVSDTDNVIHEVERLMGKNYDEEDKKNICGSMCCMYAFYSLRRYRNWKQQFR